MSSVVRACVRVLPVMLLSLGISNAHAGAFAALSLPNGADVRYGQHYLLALPEGYAADSTQQWPLIVALHGAGERGSDLALVRRRGLPAFVDSGHALPAIVVAPQTPMGQTWHPLFVDAVINEVSAQYRVDPRRIYLTGYSMGGMGTWATAIAFPTRFAALAPVAGGFPNDVMAYSMGYDTTTASDWLPVLGSLRGIPVWIAHGEADPVVPIAFDRKVEQVCNFVGMTPEVHWLTGYGHDVWTWTYSEAPGFYDWLFAQRAAGEVDPKRPAPDPRFEGTYVAANGRQASVSVSRDRLEVKWEREPALEEFLPIDRTRFIGKLLIRFDLTPGQPTRLIAPGMAYMFRRVSSDISN